MCIIKGREALYLLANIGAQPQYIARYIGAQPQYMGPLMVKYLVICRGAAPTYDTI